MKIKKDIIDKIIAHAKQGLPLEVCGYLASRNGVFSHHYEMTNIDQSQEHYFMDKEEQMKTVKEARANGFELGATYHSHPVTPARPSEEDIKLAYDPNISYVIISLFYGAIGGILKRQIGEFFRHWKLVDPDKTNGVIPEVTERG